MNVYIIRKTHIVYPACKRIWGNRMHYFDAISILNCAFDSPYVFAHEVQELFVLKLIFLSIIKISRKQHTNIIQPSPKYHQHHKHYQAMP